MTLLRPLGAYATCSLVVDQLACFVGTDLIFHFCILLWKCGEGLEIKRCDSGKALRVLFGWSADIYTALNCFWEGSVWWAVYGLVHRNLSFIKYGWLGLERFSGKRTHTPHAWFSVEWTQQCVSVWCLNLPGIAVFVYVKPEARKRKDTEDLWCANKHTPTHAHKTCTYNHVHTHKHTCVNTVSMYT